jgi:3-methylcrotonyl-CoA carboxylase alpha subunit
VSLADEAIHIGPSPAAESYLRADILVQAALSTQSDAIHPGMLNDIHSYEIIIMMK